MQANLTDLKEEASRLRKNGDYTAAVKIYSQLWNGAGEKDKWNGWGLAYCLNKAKNYEEAYRVSKEVYSLDPKFDYNVSQLSWSSYMANIKDFPEDGDLNELLELSKEIIEATQFDQGNIFRVKTVLDTIEYLSNKGDWEQAVQWTNYLDPKKLSLSEFKGQSKNGKNFVKPSERESYYLKKTKALINLKRFDECLKECNEGLESLPDSPWLLWRRGVCLSEVGKLQEAVEALNKALIFKKEWYIYRDAAIAQFKAGDYKGALNNYLEGAISSTRIPKPENRWKLYYVGGRIFEKLDEKEKAALHFSLAVKLREESGWSIINGLSEIAKNYEIEQEKTSKEILKKLEQIWIDEKQMNLPKLKGEISKFIGEGKAGFIKKENGGDIFFRTKNLLDKNLSEGDKVEFSIQKSFDKKKNRDSEEAVFIKKF